MMSSPSASRCSRNSRNRRSGRSCSATDTTGRPRSVMSAPAHVPVAQVRQRADHAPTLREGGLDVLVARRCRMRARNSSTGSAAGSGRSRTSTGRSCGRPRAWTPAPSDARRQAEHLRLVRRHRRPQPGHQRAAGPAQQVEQRRRRHAAAATSTATRRAGTPGTRPPPGRSRSRARPIRRRDGGPRRRSHQLLLRHLDRPDQRGERPRGPRPPTASTPAIRTRGRRRPARIWSRASRCSPARRSRATHPARARRRTGSWRRARRGRRPPRPALGPRSTHAIEPEDQRRRTPRSSDRVEHPRQPVAVPHGEPPARDAGRRRAAPRPVPRAARRSSRISHAEAPTSCAPQVNSTLVGVVLAVPGRLPLEARHGNRASLATG